MSGVQKGKMKFSISYTEQEGTQRNCQVTVVEQFFKKTQVQFLLMECYCGENYKLIRKKYKRIRIKISKVSW